MVIRHKRLRTEDRTVVYNNDWDFQGVLTECVRQKISSRKIGLTMKRLSRRKIPAERLGGALALVLKLV